MVSFENVSKFYEPNITALDDITFSLDQGEFVFLVGPSGAGKSTLIRLLIREELPTQGSIAFENIDVAKLSRKLLPDFRQQIGVVFQDFKLLDSKTVRENIQFALEITGKNDKEVHETTESLLEVVKLQDRGNLFPRQLSGGEKQRASIARAIANDPKLLVADEPTGNLDPETTEEIMEILEKINCWGTTLIIATHNKEVVDRLQKRVLRLEGGKLVSDQKGSYEGGRKAAKNTCKQVIKPKELSKDDKHLSFEANSINDLELPAKVVKVLNSNKIFTIGEILDLSEDELKNIKGLNSKSLVLITEKLQEYIKNFS